MPDLFEMADKARPCPCTDPKLPQFVWASTLVPFAGRGKRLLLCTTFALFLLWRNSSSPLSHDSVLKALHTDEGLLTGEECSVCASKKWDWYRPAAIVIATKTTDDVQRTLDVVRKQLPTEGYYLDQFARLLRSKPTLQLSLRTRNTEIPKCLVFVVTWFLVKVTHSPNITYHLTWSALNMVYVLHHISTSVQV